MITIMNWNSQNCDFQNINWLIHPSHQRQTDRLLCTLSPPLVYPVGHRCFQASWETSLQCVLGLPKRRAFYCDRTTKLHLLWCLPSLQSLPFYFFFSPSKLCHWHRSACLMSFISFALRSGGHSLLETPPPAEELFQESNPLITSPRCGLP